MEKSVLLLWTICLVVVYVAAKPLQLSENYDEDLLEPKDTIRYPYVFWFGRPFYEQNDDGGENAYYNSQPKQKSSTLSYASVGGGWGR